MNLILDKSAEKRCLEVAAGAGHNVIKRETDSGRGHAGLDAEAAGTPSDRLLGFQELLILFEFSECFINHLTKGF